jgi:hypothetical protein
LPSEDVMRALFCVETSGLTWLAVLGNISLAVRHPNNNGPSSVLVRDFATKLLAMLINEGVISQADAALVYRDEMRYGKL